MRSIFRVFMFLFLAASLAACGVKGKLKTPDQIEKQNAKQKEKEDKKSSDSVVTEGQ